jgi:hypothetical protein
MTYVATIVLQVRPSKRPEVISAIARSCVALRMTPGLRGLPFADGGRRRQHADGGVGVELRGGPEEFMKSEEFLVREGCACCLQKSTQLVVDEVAARTVMILED